MFQRSARRVLLSGIVLSMVALSACSAESRSSVGEQASGATAAAAPAAVAPAAAAAAPATAVMPTGATGSPGASHTGKKGARASDAVSRASAASRAQAGAYGVPGAALSGSTLYGFSAPELVLLDQSAQATQVQAMKAMGVTSVRLEANWYGLQPNGPSDSNWASFDQTIATIQAAGLSIDLIIDGCPPWAAVPGAQGNANAQPASPAQFAAFAGLVASKYGPKGVEYFEIGNEPNIEQFWAPKPDPAAYTADLVAAYAAIKAVEPSAVVLSGGLSPATDTSTSYDPRTFLEDMYADGAKGSFDGLGDHPYTYPVTPNYNNPESAWSQMSQTSPSLRSIMTENGDAAKKIWITEYGAPTSGPASVGETGQSTDLVQAIAQVKQLTWIGSFYIYTWSDLSSLAARDNGFGLLTESNTEKPAYAAVAAALAAK
jgi:polysaccharide biosynthesis protein PslG